MAWSWQGPEILRPQHLHSQGEGQEELLPHCAQLPSKGGKGPSGHTQRPHLINKDFRGGVVKVEYVGEGNPYAQESCRKERRNRDQPGGSNRVPPGDDSVLESSHASRHWVGAVIIKPTLEKGNLRLMERKELN